MTREQVLAEVTGISPNDCVQRDPQVWAMLERRPDSYDKTTGALMKEGKPHPTRANAIAVLRFDPRYADRFNYNEFTGRPEIEGAPLEDKDDVRIGLEIELAYGLQVQPKTVGELLNLLAHERAYHPVRIYLGDLVWDGVERLDGWLAHYLGVPPSPLVSAMGQRWPVSAVARIFEPGCQVDTVLILIGPQGVRKSSAFRTLASPAWFSDSMLDTGHKDAYQNLPGVWLYEFAELDSMQRREATSIKAFLTAQVDRFRPSHGRRTISQPRQVLFVGTTNESAFLNDSTGHRRFWPVVVGQIRLTALAQVRDQLWAEAVDRYQRHKAAKKDSPVYLATQWWLTDSEEARRHEVAERHAQADPWEELILRFIDGRKEVTITQVLEEGIKIDADKRHNGHTKRVGGILSAAGWEKGDRRREPGAGRVRPWHPAQVAQEK